MPNALYDPGKLPEDLEREIIRDYGFLSESTLARLAQVDRLRLVLVRWHQGRCLTPAQDAAGLIAAAEAGGWTVRAISIPASDPLSRRLRGGL